MKRREFLNGLLGALTLSALGGSRALAESFLTAAKPVNPAPIADAGSMVRGIGFHRPGFVVGAYSNNAFAPGSFKPRGDVVKKMVDSSLMKLTSAKSPADAWGTFFGPGDRVGILIDPEGTPLTRTRPEVLRAVILGLQSAGVRDNDIIVFTHRPQLLPYLGFGLNWSNRGIRFTGVAVLGYDRRYSLQISSNLVFAKRLPLANLVSKYCTHIVNIATLEDHPILGVRLALPQIAISTLAQGQRLAKYWGGSFGIDQVASWPVVKKKFVLHFIDGLAGSYDGGISQWYPQEILCSTDPVAIDRIGLSIIDSQRQRTGKMPISTARNAPRYIDAAAIRGVGIANLFKIKYRRIKVR